MTADHKLDMGVESLKYSRLREFTGLTDFWYHCYNKLRSSWPCCINSAGHFESFESYCESGIPKIVLYIESACMHFYVICFVCIDLDCISLAKRWFTFSKWWNFLLWNTKPIRILNASSFVTTLSKILNSTFVILHSVPGV